MREYTIFASVTQRRSYNVRAEDADHAADLVREEYNYMEFTILDDDIEDVTVEE